MERKAFRGLMKKLITNNKLKFMKKLNALLLLCLLFPLGLMASVWDTEYKQVEQSIREPKFPNRTFSITKYVRR